MRYRLSPWLHVGGVAIIGAYFAGRSIEHGEAVWVLVVGTVALAAWLASAWVPASRPATLRACGLAAAFAGALVAAPTDGLLIVPVITGLMAVLSKPEEPLAAGVGFAVATGVLVAVGSLSVPSSFAGLVALEGGVLVGALGGATRRQSRVRERQARELAERSAALREEEARLAVLASRQEAAREIHDVLAHSLGGLVIQLDATDALLDAGRVGEAASRVREARRLAAAGLTEARRAVGELRDPGDALPPVSGAELLAALRDLSATHTALGGRVDLSLPGSLPELQGALALAFRRGLQEALSNVRKHAPGRRATARLALEGDALVLTVRNGVAPAGRGAGLADSGGGRGIVGLRERFTALGGTLEAGAADGVFALRARAPLGRAVRSGGSGAEAPSARRDARPAAGPGEAP